MYKATAPWCIFLNIIPSMQKPRRPSEIGFLKTYCARGVLFVRSSPTMGLHSSKRSPTWRSGTMSDISGYRGTTLMLTVLPSMHTSTLDKLYSRPAMETNRGGTPSSLLSCGPTESQSTDVWAVPRTLLQPAHIHFCPLTLLKQLTSFLHQTLLFHQLTSLLGALSPSRNISLTWQHSPWACTLLESKP